MAGKKDPDTGLVPFNYPLNGRLITKLDGSLLPDAHFQTLENLRYTDSGIESVKGMSKINSTVLAKLKVQNGFQFKKAAPAAESHTFIQVTNPTDGTSAIYKSDNTKVVSTITFTFAATTTVVASADCTAQGVAVGQSIYNSTNDTLTSAVEISAISSNGLTITLKSAYAGTTGAGKTGTRVFNVPYPTTYTLFKTLTNDNTVYFSEAPDQSMVFCDGTYNHIWSGDEYRVAKFINFDPSDSFSYDFTTQANNNLTNANNVFALGRVLSGISPTTKGLWHFDDALTDSSGNSNTLTGVGTPTYTAAGFTKCLTLNGSSQYVYRASDSDFSMTDGEWAFDGRFRVHDLDNVQPILYWKTDIKRIEYETGTSAAPAVGSVIWGHTSSGSGYVTKVTTTGGSWAGNNAVGIIYYSVISGTLVNGEEIRITNDSGAKLCDVDADGGEADVGDNYVKLSISTAGAINFVIYECYPTAGNVVEMSSPDGVVTANTWIYIEVDEDGDDWYLFAGAESSTVTLYDSLTTAGGDQDTSRAEFYYGNFTLGYDNSTYYDGDMEEVRFSSDAVHTDVFSVPVAAYSSEYAAHVYVGSTRPLDGVKFYVSTANATAGTVVGYYWSGSAWTALASLVDGTSTSGKPLAKTGSITFTSTVDTAKIKVIEENIAYFYYFVFYSIDATTALSEVTVSAPVQTIVDIWDGVPRQVYAAQLYQIGTNKTIDNTINAYALDYDSDLADTYVNVYNYCTTGSYLACGFNERLTGIKVYMGGTNVNSVTASMEVYYWGGSGWVSVGSIVDGTSINGKTLNRTGIISWDAPASVSEFTTSVANSAKWYYYKLQWSTQLTSATRIDHVAGLPVQNEVAPYRYPLLWQNRLWLLNDQSKAANSAIGSSYGTNCVFNGTDSGTLLFGGSRGVVAGATLFTRFGSSLYENLIVCKSNETYLVDGTSFTGDSSGAGAFVVYQVSGVRGCIAPLTMKACDTGYEVAAGVTKHVLAWLSNSGVVMFDSNSIIEVSSDISDKFMLGESTGISATLASESAAFYNATRGEYHLLVPTGTSPTYLNEELVYDTIRKRWFNMKRSTKYLWCGFPVEDSYGNQYIYGGTGDGYIERLDNGNTFDGVSIAYKFRLPDSLLNESWDTRKEIRNIRLVGKCKTTTTQTVAVTHYADGNTTASTPAITAIANKKTGRRFYKFQRSVSFRGVTHSLEFSISTSDEYGGFDPLYVSGLYKVIDYDLEEV